MLLGIMLKLKGKTPAGDGGLQCSVTEEMNENKVSDTFPFTQISTGLFYTSSLLLSFLTRFSGRWLSLSWQSYTPARSQVYCRAHFITVSLLLSDSKESFLVQSVDFRVVRSSVISDLCWMLDWCGVFVGCWVYADETSLLSNDDVKHLMARVEDYDTDTKNALLIQLPVALFTLMTVTLNIFIWYDIFTCILKDVQAFLNPFPSSRSEPKPSWLPVCSN